MALDAIGVKAQSINQSNESIFKETWIRKKMMMVKHSLGEHVLRLPLVFEKRIEVWVVES